MIQFETETGKYVAFIPAGNYISLCNDTGKPKEGDRMVSVAKAREGNTDVIAVSFEGNYQRFGVRSGNETEPPPDPYAGMRNREPF